MNTETRDLARKVTKAKRHLFLPVLSLLIVLSGSSCSSDTERSHRPEASVTTESVVQLPSSLQAMEQEAEEVITLAGEEKWAAVGQKLAAISTTWEEYVPQIPVEAASEKFEQVQAQIEILRAYAQVRERVNTMQAANDLSGLVVDLFELYHPDVPVGLERLDIAERQVLLDAEGGNLEMAQIAIDKSRGYWNQLKAAVIYHGGEQLSEKFEASLDLQHDYLKAGNQDLLSEEVENALEILDMIEDLF